MATLTLTVLPRFLAPESLDQHLVASTLGQSSSHHPVLVGQEHKPRRADQELAQPLSCRATTPEFQTEKWRYRTSLWVFLLTSHYLDKDVLVIFPTT